MSHSFHQTIVYTSTFIQTRATATRLRAGPHTETSLGAPKSFVLLHECFRQQLLQKQNYLNPK